MDLKASRQMTNTLRLEHCYIGLGVAKGQSRPEKPKLGVGQGQGGIMDIAYKIQGHK